MNSKGIMYIECKVTEIKTVLSLQTTLSMCCWHVTQDKARSERLVCKSMTTHMYISYILWNASTTQYNMTIIITVVQFNTR